MLIKTIRKLIMTMNKTSHSMTGNTSKNAVFIDVVRGGAVAVWIVVNAVALWVLLWVVVNEPNWLMIT